MKRLAAPRALVLIRGGEGFLFGLIFAATMVYMVEVGLSALQLILVGTALEGAVFLFEVPTGVVADRMSRRISTAMGFAITGAAFVLMGARGTFPAIVAASALWGFGYTFTSGAIDAWLVDEVGQARAEPLLARGVAVSSIASVAGTVGGIGLAAIKTALPIWIGGVLFVTLALAVHLLVPEEGFAGNRGVGLTGQLRESVATLRGGLKSVRASAILVGILLMTFLFGAFSEGFDRLRDAHLIRTIGVPESLKPVVWIGLIGIAARLLTALGSRVLETRIVRMRRPGIPLSVLFAIIGASVVLFAWIGGFWVGAALLVVTGTCRGLSRPVHSAWVNRHVRSEVRATVLSFYGQADSLGQVALGPIVGIIGNAAGLPIAISVGAAVLVPAIVIAALSSRSTGNSAS